MTNEKKRKNVNVEVPSIRGHDVDVVKKMLKFRRKWLIKRQENEVRSCRSN